MERLTSFIKPWVSYSRLRGIRTLHKRWISSSHTLQYQFEPDLNLEPEIPEYDTVNVKIQGFEHTPLESFSKYVQQRAQCLGIDNSRFAVPAQKMEIKSLVYGKQTVTDTFELNYYERVVQLQNLPSIKLQILLDMIVGCTPEGVTITLKKNTLEDDEFLYIPDHQSQRIDELIKNIESRTMRT